MCVCEGGKGGGGGGGGGGRSSRKDVKLQYYIIMVSKYPGRKRVKVC